MYLVVTALLALQYLRAEVLVTQDEGRLALAFSNHWHEFLGNSVFSSAFYM